MEEIVDETEGGEILFATDRQGNYGAATVNDISGNFESVGEKSDTCMMVSLDLVLHCGMLEALTKILNCVLILLHFQGILELVMLQL